MKYLTLRNLLLRTFVATCVVGWVAAGCGGSNGAGLGASLGTGADGGSSGSSSGSSSGGSSGGPSGTSSSGSASGGSSGGMSSSGAPSDGGSPEGSSGSGHEGGGPPPPAAACKAGDRKEWSGSLANTGIDVAVCSVCGASYVVASNGSGGAGQVTVANGSRTITVNVPAGGTATSANLADRPSDGTVTVCATGTSQACIPMDPQNQRYCNPYRDLTNLVAESINQGVDYGGAGPIYAMGPGIIDVYKNRDDSGWPGGTFVSYKLSAGPAAGQTIYLAENIDLDPSLQSGSFVYNGTALGTLVDASPDSESGWGVAGQSYTAEYGCYTEGCMTPLGENFNSLLVCLNAPSGTMGTGGCCAQPTGWPTDWCSLVTAWQ